MLFDQMDPAANVKKLVVKIVDQTVKEMPEREWLRQLCVSRRVLPSHCLRSHL